MLVNRYATFVRDIEPQGFDLAVMDGFLSKSTIQAVSEILCSQDRKERMVNHNFGIASKHFSYGVLRYHLNAILNRFFGDRVRRLTVKSVPKKKFSKTSPDFAHMQSRLFDSLDCRDADAESNPIWFNHISAHPETFFCTVCVQFRNEAFFRWARRHKGFRWGVLPVRRNRKHAENAAQRKKGHLWMDTK